MKEIQDISLPRMNNGAHFTFVSNILARAEADSKVKAKAAELVTALKEAVAAEDEALKISQKSLLTDEIAKADSDRDALYAGYKKAVEGFQAMPIADMAQAAKELAQHIKDYRISTTDQLDKETGLLVNFIADLETKFATQVTTLSLTAFVTNLKEANERVRTLTLQRTEDRMALPIGAMKTARATSDEAYRQLVKMVNALARLFRISISRGHELIPIRSELQHAESYLQIQKHRYKDQFCYRFDVDEGCLDYLCNKITLQPIIENAIYHGINGLVDEGEITITIRPEGEDILFVVADNGVGMEPAQIEAMLRKERSDRTGIGIKNVNDRLKIYFGEKYGITIDSEPDEGTSVTIRMPKILKEEDYENR